VSRRPRTVGGAPRPQRPDPAAVHPEEAAQALRIGRTRLYALLADNTLPSVRIGHSRRITVRAVEVDGSIPADRRSRWTTGPPSGSSPTPESGQRRWPRTSRSCASTLPVLGGRSLAAVTPSDIQRLANAWSSRPAPRTVSRQYDVVRAMLRSAVEADRLVRSPCRGIKLPAIPTPERHALVNDELASLARAVGPTYEPTVWLGALLGLRWGECSGLRVGRIDFLNRCLAVVEQATRVAHGRIVFGPPRSDAGRRTLSLPAALVDVLAGHLAARGLSAADRTALVFVSPRGEVIDYGHWRQRVWLPACREAHVEGLTFHDLRQRNPSLTG
jgi:excisionase family DNA binding protein